MGLYLKHRRKASKYVYKQLNIILFNTNEIKIKSEYLSQHDDTKLEIHRTPKEFDMF